MAGIENSESDLVLAGVVMPAALELLDKAASHFRSNLLQAPDVIKFLKGRGVRPEIAARYGIGYSGSEWKGLNFIFEKFSKEVVKSSGLQTDTGVSRFHQRVMFPVRDVTGRVVGFGGRVIDDALPKYLNTPETENYKKGNLLYGLYEAKDAIRDSGLVVVVEGYLDVIALAQEGFSSVVGVCGTACSKAQINLLLPLASRVVFCFDGDAAGVKAAQAVLQEVLPLANDSVDFRFLFLPEDHDPDSFVKAFGIEAFNNLLVRSQSLLEMIVQLQKSAFNLESDDDVARCLMSIKGLWVLLPDGVVREDLLDFAVNISGLSDAEVLSVWNVEY